MHAPLTETQAYLVLNALPHLGPITVNRLLAALGDDPRLIFTASRAELEPVRGVGPVILDTLLHWRDHVDLAREEARLAEAQARFVTVRDGAYPPALREIADPPLGLYVKGPADLTRPAVAIVGSRRTTLYGQAVAKKLAAELATRGYLVVSGLARGIDTAAHEGALSVQGRTAAVLGNGIDIVYPPENLALFRRLEAEGAIVSEFPFTRRADRQSFAMRNRIVSGICAAVVVVESDVSGGSMITARFAGEQGRLLFAVPGRIDQATSAGCHQLIRDGATLLTSVHDLLDELNYLDGLRPAGQAAVAASVSTGFLSASAPAADATTRAGKTTRAGGGSGAGVGQGVNAGLGAAGGTRAAPREGELDFTAESPASAALPPSPATARAARTFVLTAVEQQVLACFADGALLTLDDLVAQTALPVPQLSATLMMLELKRLLAKRADGRFEARARA